MKPQTLNQLIVDRAAEQMDADVAELLDAYLFHDAPAARRLSEYRDTISLAARLLRDDVPTAAVPQFPAARIAAANQRRVVAGWLHPVAVAAGLALAFLTGMKWNLPARPFDTPALVAAVEPTGGFWAADSVRAAMADRRSVESNKVHWSSPLRWPQIGGQS